MTRLVQSLCFALTWLAEVLWAFTGAALVHRFRMARLNYRHRQFAKDPVPVLFDDDLPLQPPGDFDEFISVPTKKAVRR